MIANPDLTADPDIAAKIAVDGMKYGRFTGAKLSRYVNDKKPDFYNARRVINGIDKASLIAGHANSYLKALNDCGW